MDTNSLVNITSSLLNSLEKTSGLTDLPSLESFLEILKLNKAIVYLLVDWSGPERVSRYNIYKALNEFGGKCDLPVFKIDCSDQRKEYVIDWLIAQRENKKEFYYGGWGETLLIEKGTIVDLISNPGQLGLDKTKEKLKEWANTGANTGL